MTDIKRARKALKTLQEILDESREARTATCPVCGYHGVGGVYGGPASPLYCKKCDAVIRDPFGTPEEIAEHQAWLEEEKQKRELQDRIERSIVIEVVDYEGNLVEFLIDPQSLDHTRISESTAYGLTITVRKATKEEVK